MALDNGDICASFHNVKACMIHVIHAMSSQLNTPVPTPIYWSKVEDHKN